MMLYLWLAFVVIVGLMVGSFLNVCIARLPLEKSLIWPGSRCGTCQQPIRWYDNLPLLSYLWLQGRCRSCGSSFSIQYFLVELATGTAFGVLFYFEAVVNVHEWYEPSGASWHFGPLPWTWIAGFAYHAFLVSILIAASVADLNGREIPLPLTLTGTVIGIAGGVLMPWPWPWPVELASPRPGPGVPSGMEWLALEGGLREGIQPWPVWGPLPSWLAPGGNWQTGLITSLAGALVGSLVMRGIGAVFSAGLGKEALGLGDADLMMMVGAFFGWQIVVVAIFVSVIPAAVVGVIQLLVNRDHASPFGPSLAAGSLVTYFFWPWRPPGLHLLLFHWPFLLGLTVFAALFLFVAAVVIRSARPRETGG
ncbi:MAG: prepilin peptidase [Gemmataceae bacterium]|nr:prepilin peptidase [Gemmataceae bacterium]